MEQNCGGWHTPTCYSCSEPVGTGVVGIREAQSNISLLRNGDDILTTANDIEAHALDYYS